MLAAVDHLVVAVVVVVVVVGGGGGGDDGDGVVRFGKDNRMVLLTLVVMVRVWSLEVGHVRRII